MLRTVLLLAAPLLAAALPTAQVRSIAGPRQAGLGHQIVVSLSNDDVVSAWIDGSYTVTDAAGALVYTNPPWPSLVTVGTTYFAPWNQQDALGRPVLAGTYRIDVDVPDPATGAVSVESHFVTIAGDTPSIAPRGVPRIGTTRSYQLTATQHALAPYVVLASLGTSTGIGTCAGTIPLDVDPLLFASLTQPAVFPGFAGTLDVFGKSISPQLALPPDPGLVGVGYSLAFFTLDPTSPCFVGAISAAESLVVR